MTSEFHPTTCFTDIDGDGKKDMITQNPGSPEIVYWLKNRSINNNSILQFLSQKLDTVYKLDVSDDKVSITKIDTIRIDSSVFWGGSFMFLKNPKTGKMELPWFKIREITVSGIYSKYYIKNVFIDSFFYTSGSPCGTFSSDTFHKRIFEQSFLKSIYSYNSKNYLYENLDTTFTDPSAINLIENLLMNK